VAFIYFITEDIYHFSNPIKIPSAFSTTLYIFKKYRLLAQASAWVIIGSNINYMREENKHIYLFTGTSGRLAPTRGLD